MADQMFTMDRRARWSDSEISAMLNIIYEMNVAKVLEAKRQRNKDIFKNIESGMKELGYNKNWDQIRAKWKMLKSTYLAKKKKTSDTAIFGDPSCKHYEQMDNLLQTGIHDSPDFNASDILEIIMNNEDESDNNSSSPAEPPQPSPCCSTTSNTSISDSNITNKTNNDVSQSSSSIHNDSIHLDSNFPAKQNARILSDVIKNNQNSTEMDDFMLKQTPRNGNNRKRKRSTPYEEALMKFQISQAKLYRQLQKEENEWMEKQLEKMQQHDERLIQAQTEQMKEMIRSVGLILEPIIQRSTNRLTNHNNNTCKEIKKS